MRSTSSLSMWTLVVLVFALLSQVTAVTYLESLSAKRRPVTMSLNDAVIPTRTSGASVEANDLDLLSHQFDRRAASAAELASLTTCQSVAIDVPLVDIQCTTVLTATVCLPVTITVRVKDSICICASAGAITDKSLLDLRTFFIDVNNNKTGSPLATLTTYRNGAVGYTVDSLIQYLAGPDALPTVLNDGRSKDTCKYPTGAVPYCSANCGFNCPTDQRVCNDKCMAVASCPSGIPGRRRALSIKQPELDLRCTRGRTACFPPSFGMGRSSHMEERMECIDTMRDIESCGGCAFPLPNRQQGVDCTEIPNAGEVACVSGVCRVKTCQPGFIAVDGSTCRPRNESSTGMDPALDDNTVDVVDNEGDMVTASDHSSGGQVVIGEVRQVSPEDRKAEAKRLLASRQVTAKQLRDREASKGRKSVRNSNSQPRIFKRRW